MTPSPNSTCPECGTLIPQDAPQGLCPRCLMLGAAAPTQSLFGAMAFPTVEEIQTAFPDFEVTHLIGRGGMAAVFRARQRKLDREVALKVLPRALAADPAFAERFHREARALAKLNHPNIVTVHDFGEQGGWFYLLMELVDGVNLRQAMRTNRFTPEQALEIVPKICEALHYAHGEGVLHRDIKPENILLDAKGRVKIADFGIAKLGQQPGQDATLTMSGARLGTVAYMAPEQIEHPSDVDHRADIYSLGVVFYELLTGELPIGRFSAPSEKSPVNTQVDDVVFRTLEKERERRYQSAGEMKTQVETLVGQTSPATGHTPISEPSLAQPPPPAQLPKKRRGPVAAIVFILVGCLLCSLNLVAFTARTVVHSSHQGYAHQPPVAAMGVGILTLSVGVGLILLGTQLGWSNVLRLRNTASPRTGLVRASIAALLVPFVIIWMLLAVNIRKEALAWIDGISITAILLFLYCCWVNPHPRPWSLKAVAASILVMVPILLLAHAWQGYHEDIDTAWAQEMNYLQERINEIQRMGSNGAMNANSMRLQEANLQLSQLHMMRRPTHIPPLSSDIRAYFAVAALIAILGTLLGWFARAELLQAPNSKRGLLLAKFAAYFWPIALVPLLLLLLA